MGATLRRLVPQTKITIPELPAEYVARPGLLADLDVGAAADVALVCAPAGWGKTLLLADWSRASTDTETAWVGLDRDDNDPRRLWASIIAAVAACPSVPSSSRLHAPFVWAPADQPEFVAEFVDALAALPRPVRLILDDVHELVSQEALRGIEILTRNRVAGVALVLSSRFDPPLSLSRLRVAGRMWELRAARLGFSPGETATLLAKTRVALTPGLVDVLHRRTGGWVAGLRLAAVGLLGASDRDAFLAGFSGDERSVADYIVGEILSGLPEDVLEFLRTISISDPIPAALAAELSGRDEAGRLLDGLEHRTSLVSPTGGQRDTYRIQELLRTHLLADLQRQGRRRTIELHTVAAHWWADQDEPARALEQAERCHDTDLLTELVHRFGVRLIVAGGHAQLRSALSTVGVRATALDPWLALTSALVHLEAGEAAAARVDLHHARQAWPSDEPSDLTLLRAMVEQCGVDLTASAYPIPDPDQLPAEPALEALAHLGRARARIARDDRAGAYSKLDAALTLSRRHGFDYLAMQCLALAGALAGTRGDVSTMQAMCDETLSCAAAHGWEGSVWSGTASAVLAYAALQRADVNGAERLSAAGLVRGLAAPHPQVRFALQAVHGAAAFDGGDRPGGLAELQQARSELGDVSVGPEQAALVAMLEFRAALLLGHSAAARTVFGWLAERTSDNAELLVVRAWTEAAGGRFDQARAVVKPVRGGLVRALLPHTAVEAWLLESSLAVRAGERPAARRALQAALAVAEPLDVLRPFTMAGPGIRELLVRQHGSFGASQEFADRALAAGAGHGKAEAVLSERELTVLGLLPSLLSLSEIAADLTVSVNTVKSHIGSIYTKLGVSSRRQAVLAAHDRGLLSTR